MFLILAFHAPNCSGVERSVLVSRFVGRIYSIDLNDLASISGYVGNQFWVNH